MIRRVQQPAGAGRSRQGMALMIAVVAISLATTITFRATRNAVGDLLQSNREIWSVQAEWIAEAFEQSLRAAQSPGADPTDFDRELPLPGPAGDTASVVLRTEVDGESRRRFLEVRVPAGDPTGVVAVRRLQVE